MIYLHTVYYKYCYSKSKLYLHFLQYTIPLVRDVRQATRVGEFHVDQRPRPSAATGPRADRCG